MPGKEMRNSVVDDRITTPETAFQELHEPLRRYVSRRVKNREETEDVLQDVFLRVIRNERSLREVASPVAWLYTVTRSVLIDHYRRQSRSPIQNRVDLEDVEIPVPPERPEVDFGACVLPLVNKLPEKYREAVEFVDVHGGRQTALAHKTGLSDSAAKSRVQRGRKMLKESILNCCRVELDNFNRIVAMDRMDKNRKECC